jgi:hypothetical protein
MPLMQCKTESGGSGWKFGSSGKCYANKKDAIRQGLAITGSPEKLAKELGKGTLLQQDIELVHSVLYQSGYPLTTLDSIRLMLHSLDKQK